MSEIVSLFVSSSLLPCTVHHQWKILLLFKNTEQAESKIWFFSAHWDDDIFLSHSFPSKWYFNILLRQKRENKLSENLPLTSWQIPTENWLRKLTVTSLSCRRTGGCGSAEWIRACIVCPEITERDCVCAGGDDVSINAWVGEALNKIRSLFGTQSLQHQWNQRVGAVIGNQEPRLPSKTCSF